MLARYATLSPLVTTFIASIYETSIHLKAVLENKRNANINRRINNLN